MIHDKGAAVVKVLEESMIHISYPRNISFIKKNFHIG